MNTEVSIKPSAAIAKRDPMSNLKGLLDRSKAEIAAALPKHLTPERMMRIALTEVRKLPDLLNCDQVSFIGAVIQAAQLGLEPGGALGHCYLLPFNNKRRGVKEVQLIIGYRGMLDMVRRSGNIAHVIPRAVYDCDKFSYHYGLQEKLEHVPGDRTEKSVITHVYAIGFLKENNHPIFDVMTIKEVHAIRNAVYKWESGPWNSDFEAMAKKTVIRRLFKYLPSSAEFQRAISLDEQADAGLPQDNSSVIDVKGTPVEDPASKLNALLEDKPSEPGDFDSFNQEPIGAPNESASA